MSKISSFSALALVGALGLALTTTAVDAKIGGGGSFGSRGSRTFSAPPPTATSPFSAAPIQRSMTPPGMSQPFRPQPAARGGFFGGGLGRGLLGGFLGAGLFGLLMGHGLFGGMGGLTSIFGLIIQLGLIYLLVRLVMNFFRSRQPGYAAGPAGGGSFGFNGGPQPAASPGGLGMGGMGLGGLGGLGARPPAAPVIGPDDFSAFERMLADVQTAFGAEDMGRARAMLTPEMASFFAEELADNARKGLVNAIGEVKLLQGDLAEAWAENGADYATVTMRFSMVDAMIERASGRIVSGDRTTPQVSTEAWTFTRPTGASVRDWKLSAIQQAGAAA